MGVSEGVLLSGSPGSGEVFGQLFASLAALTVRASAVRAEARVYHLRTRDRLQEIDLIAERYDGAVIAIEVKLAHTVDDRDVCHLHWLGNQLGERRVDKLVIHAGPAAYRRPDGVAVVPLALLG